MSVNYNHYPLADKYGIRRNTARRRLQMMGLGDSDHALAAMLQAEVIRPQVEHIIEQFYVYIMQQEEMRFFVRDDAALQRLKHTQTEYLLSLGVDFDSPTYLEYRLRVGLAHDRINLPLRYYLAAYSKLQELIINAIPSAIRQQPQQLFALIGFINRIIAYDVSLAVDIYHTVRIDDMSQSIDSLIDERNLLSQAVEHDVLTDCYSRRYILEFLKQKLAELRRDTDRVFCLAMLDLDHFKRVNDNYSHLVGDHVLQTVVVRILACIREVDQLGRYGGEEFILILPDVDLEVAGNITERVRLSVANHPIITDSHEIPMTISGGLCQACEDDTPESLIDRTDSMLYRAKDEGRNRVVCCD